jgi:CRISPR-associated protein Cas1
MQLVLNTYGAYLRKKGSCFLVKTDDRQLELSVRKVDSILIATSAFLSTDAVKLALEHNIDIVFLDSRGDPYARVWHPKLGSTTLIRRCQLELSAKKEGFSFARGWVMTKVENQLDLLRELVRTRKGKEQFIKPAIAELASLCSEITALSGSTEELRGKLLSLEAQAGRIYFQAISLIMPASFRFGGRSRHPARDGFNALLNYCYGILYSLVEKACIIAGLDPYIGFFHADNYNRKSLVFDLIEPYRIWGDRTVIKLIAGRKVGKSHFDPIPAGLSLNEEGRKLLISEFNKFLEKQVRYRGRNIRRRNIIQFDCHRLANSLIKGKKEDK